MTPSARHQFLREYTYIRHAEGRGSDDSAYYRALPAQWGIRARSCRYMERHILPKPPADILDLGAGNCWLSNRLSLRKHRPVALDILSDDRDGLRAARHYLTSFPRVEAEFDHLPFADASFDMVIFNSSFHYSTDYARTLREARRCLRAAGRIAIVDSPTYKRHEHGELMRKERHKRFEALYGFSSSSIPSVEFFDLAMLDSLARELNLKWEIHRPWYGFAWHLRPLAAYLRGARPPSRFWILVAR